eukprot:TRINITY_DN15403_c0_g1_i1.p1 TRINITY_DN15403_c0_g1~~TRINITY_DN15403_c0_g1_i1.p1  ORF type:complete len:279 (+),score=73.61 TRINITY_DN15403_c0_g1_i1:2-838(+)
MSQLTEVGSSVSVQVEDDAKLEKESSGGDGEPDKNNEFEMSLPTSTYSLSIVMFGGIGELITKSKHDLEMESLHICFFFSLCVIQGLGFLVTSIFLEGYFTYYIYVIAAANDQTCDNTPANLRFACVLIFLLACIGDLAETYRMVLYLSSKKIEDDLLYDEVLDNPKFHWFCYIVVILPKILLAFAILFVGTYFLVRSESINDLVLNTLAATFILQIDDLLYLAVTTLAWDRMIKEAAKAKHVMGEFESQVSFGCGLCGWVALGIVIASAYGLSQMYC